MSTKLQSKKPNTSTANNIQPIITAIQTLILAQNLVIENKYDKLIMLFNKDKDTFNAAINYKIRDNIKSNTHPLYLSLFHQVYDIRIFKLLMPDDMDISSRKVLIKLIIENVKIDTTTKLKFINLLMPKDDDSKNELLLKDVENGKSLLHNLCNSYNGDVQLFKLLMPNEPKLKNKLLTSGIKTQNTPLHTALLNDKQDNIDVINLLMPSNDKFKNKLLLSLNTYDETPLHLALQNNSSNIEIIELLIPDDKKYKNELLLKLDDTKYSPLHIALKNNTINIKIINLLIPDDEKSKNELLLKLDDTESTPLHMVLKKKAITNDIINLLIPDDKKYKNKLLLKLDDTESTPLHIALEKKSINIEIIKLLIPVDDDTKKNELLLKINEFYKTPLNVALKNKSVDIEIIKLLIPDDETSKNELLLKINEFYKTPLHTALLNESIDIEIIQLLIPNDETSKNKLLLQIDKFLYTPLHIALKSLIYDTIDIEIIKLLIPDDETSKNKLLLQLDVNRSTPLHIALNDEFIDIDIEIIKLLIPDDDVSKNKLLSIITNNNTIPLKSLIPDEKHYLEIQKIFFNKNNDLIIDIYTFLFKLFIPNDSKENVEGNQDYTTMLKNINYILDLYNTYFDFDKDIKNIDEKIVVLPQMNLKLDAETNTLEYFNEDGQISKNLTTKLSVTIGRGSNAGGLTNQFYHELSNVFKSTYLKKSTKSNYYFLKPLYKDKDKLVINQISRILFRHLYCDRALNIYLNSIHIIHLFEKINDIKTFDKLIDNVIIKDKCTINECIHLFMYVFIVIVIDNNKNNKICYEFLREIFGVNFNNTLTGTEFYNDIFAKFSETIQYALNNNNNNNLNNVANKKQNMKSLIIMLLNYYFADNEDKLTAEHKAEPIILLKSKINTIVYINNEIYKLMGEYKLHGSLLMYDGFNNYMSIKHVFQLGSKIDKAELFEKFVFENNVNTDNSQEFINKFTALYNSDTIKIDPHIKHFLFNMSGNTVVKDRYVFNLEDGETNAVANFHTCFSSVDINISALRNYVLLKYNTETDPDKIPKDKKYDEIYNDILINNLFTKFEDMTLAGGGVLSYNKTNNKYNKQTKNKTQLKHKLNLKTHKKNNKHKTKPNKHKIVSYKAKKTLPGYKKSKKLN